MQLDEQMLTGKVEHSSFNSFQNTFFYSYINFSSTKL